MLYLKWFWILLVVFGLVYFLAFIFKRKHVKSFMNNYGILYVIGLTSLLIMAIVTDDPITLWGITIPTEMQWLGSLLVTGFGAWRFYLNPLKNKVYGLDREIGEVKSDVSSIKSDVHLIKENIIKK